MSQFPCPHCQAAVSEPAPACPACGGALSFDGMQLHALLGRGGMGAVYGASGPGGRAAVKVLSLGQGGDWKSYELFEQSTRVLMGLSHPGLPAVYSFSRTEAGRLFLVRERFEGGTLSERIKGGARLSSAEFDALFLALLGILDFLHRQIPPVYHRDIKPSNIMFRAEKDWAPVLVDFDTVAAPESLRSGLTMVGTPGYAAPEQFAGMVSAASDLYSLGATMLLVATHTEPDALPKHNGRFQVEPLLAGLSASARAALLRLLEPERERRFQSAREVIEALRPMRRAPQPVPLQGQRVEAPPSRVGRVVALGAGVLLLGGALGFLVLAPSPARPPAASVVPSSLHVMEAAAPPAELEPAPAPAPPAWEALSSEGGTLFLASAGVGETLFLGGTQGRVFSGPGGDLQARYKSKNHHAIAGFWSLPGGAAVALKENGDALLSADGLTWTEQPAKRKHEREFQLHDVWASPTGEVFAAGAWGKINSVALGGAMISMTSVGTVYRVDPKTAKLSRLWTGDPLLRALSGTQDAIYAVGSLSGVYVSRNQGKKFEPLPVPAELGGEQQLRGVAACAGALFVVGDGGVILASQDLAAAPLQVMPSGTPKDLYDVLCTSARDAFAVGDSGTILRTDDGGATWSVEPSGTSARLETIARTGTQLWAAGNSGALLRRRAPLSASGSASAPAAEGPARDALTAVARKSRPAFRRCYENELMVAPALGSLRLSLSLQIAPSGEVRAATVDSKNVSADLLSCLKKAGESLRFPAGDDRSLTFPLVFEEVEY